MQRVVQRDAFAGADDGDGVAYGWEIDDGDAVNFAEVIDGGVAHADFPWRIGQRKNQTAIGIKNRGAVIGDGQTATGHVAFADDDDDLFGEKPTAAKKEIEKKRNTEKEGI